MKFDLEAFAGATSTALQKNLLQDAENTLETTKSLKKQAGFLKGRAAEKEVSSQAAEGYATLKKKAVDVQTQVGVTVLTLAGDAMLKSLISENTIMCGALQADINSKMAVVDNKLNDISHDGLIRSVDQRRRQLDDAQALLENGKLTQDDYNELCALIKAKANAIMNNNVSRLGTAMNNITSMHNMMSGMFSPKK